MRFKPSIPNRFGGAYGKNTKNAVDPFQSGLCIIIQFAVKNIHSGTDNPPPTKTKRSFAVKKDYNVIYEAHCILEDYIKRTQTPPKQKKKPHSPSVTPLITAALIFALLCVINLFLWFLH